MDLKALMAKQKAQKESQDAQPVKPAEVIAQEPAPVSPQPGTALALRPQGIRIGLLQPKSGSAVVDDSAAGGNPDEGRATDSAGVGSDSQSASAVIPAAKPLRTPVNESLTLSDLAAIDTRTIDAEFVQVSGFDDEIAATKPHRVKFEDQSKDEQGFADSLDSLYELLHDVDTFRAVVESIMIELSSNPEYRRQIVDEDVHNMIATMRNGAGLARIEKQVAKAKRATGGSTSAKAKAGNAAVEDAMAMLQMLGGAGD